MNRDADFKLGSARKHEHTSQVLDRLDHLEGSHDASQSMVAHFHRMTPKSYGGVADKLVERASRFENDCGHSFEVVIQEVHDLFGRHLFREVREPANV